MYAALLLLEPKYQPTYFQRPIFVAITWRKQVLRWGFIALLLLLKIRCAQKQVSLLANRHWLLFSGDRALNSRFGWHTDLLIRNCFLPKGWNNR